MRSGEGGCFGCCSGCVGEVLHHAAFSNTRSLARLPQHCQHFATHSAQRCGRILGSESAHSISPCCNSHHGAAHEFNSCQMQAGTALTTAPGTRVAWSRTALCPAPAVPCSTGWLLWAPLQRHLDMISLPADITSGLSRLQFQALRLMRWDSPRAVDLKTWNFQVLLYFL